MKYRALAAVLGTAAILSAGAASAEAPYTDLNTLPQRAAVDYLYDTQCLTFVTGDQFHPNTVLTRGDLAQLIYNAAANMPLANPEFKDVQPGRAADAMAAVAAQGILTGYEDGSFQPDKEVTREEFAGVLYRYLQYCRLADADGEVEAYADESDVSPAELTAVQVLHMSWCPTITISVRKTALPAWKRPRSYTACSIRTKTTYPTCRWKCRS